MGFCFGFDIVVVVINIGKLLCEGSKVIVRRVLVLVKCVVDQLVIDK